jgi:hypothetical protein
MLRGTFQEDQLDDMFAELIDRRWREYHGKVLQEVQDRRQRDSPEFFKPFWPPHQQSASRKSRTDAAHLAARL